MTTLPTDATDGGDTDGLPATTITRPLHIGAAQDVRYAVNALDGRVGSRSDNDVTDEIDRPQPSPVGKWATESPDRTGRQRWTSLLLGVLGFFAVAALVVGVVTVAGGSSAPGVTAERPALTPVTSKVAATTTLAVPSPSANGPSTTEPPTAPAQPPPYDTVTATASSVVVAPPPAVVAPTPKPNLRERLHDLFPKLFPN